MICRVLTKDDVYEMIREEYKVIKETNEGTVTQLEVMITDLKIKLTEANREIIRLTKEKEKKVVWEDKGVQFSVWDVTTAHETEELATYNENINSFIVGGQKKPKEWVLSVISDVLSSKMLADYSDFNHRRPLCPLREYLVHFFLKQFGCRSVAITLLKDFALSLKEWFGESSRVEGFMDMCGFFELKHMPNFDIKKYISTNKVMSLLRRSNWLA